MNVEVIRKKPSPPYWARALFESGSIVMSGYWLWWLLTHVGGFWGLTAALFVVLQGSAVVYYLIDTIRSWREEVRDAA